MEIYSGYLRLSNTVDGVQDNEIIEWEWVYLLLTSCIAGGYFLTAAEYRSTGELI